MSCIFNISMNHTIKELKNQIVSQQFHPVYVLWGEEAFLQNKSIQLITDGIITVPEKKDFNYNLFYAKEHSTRQIQEAVETLPVLSQHRLVVCRDAHLLKEADWDFLKPLIQKPVTSSILVFVLSNLDRRKKSSKFLMEYSFVVKNQLDSQKDVSRWVKWLGIQYDLQFAEGSMDLLIQQAGPSLMGIDNELKKIKSFLGDQSLVTQKNILEIVARVRPENIFSFSEAIGTRDLKKSFQLLARLLEDQGNEMSLLALVFRHIRILSQVKEGMENGLRGADLSAKVGVPSFFLKDYVKQMRLWDHKKLAQVTEILYATDKALKSSPLSSHIWLENFVLKACSL